MRVRSEFRNRYLFLLDAGFLPAATLLAYAIRFEGLHWGAEQRQTALWFIAIGVPLKLGIFLVAGLYRRLWRYASVKELEQIIVGVVWAGLASFALGFALLPASGLVAVRVPISVLILDGFLMGHVVAVPRLLLRVLGRRRVRGRQEVVRRVLIAGAGSVGGMIARELGEHPHLGLVPIGFLDDDAGKLGQRLQNLQVLGGMTEIPHLARRLAVDEVIIAMPSASGQVIREVVRSAAQAGVGTRIVPGMLDILAGNVSVSTLRKVEIQDLLRREPVETNLEEVRSLAKGQVVLVTGAGGSIGSELCRQLAQLDPARLVLLGHGENSIFEIQQELTGPVPATFALESVIADVRDRERLARVFERFEPFTGVPCRRAQARAADGGERRRGGHQQRAGHQERGRAGRRERGVEHLVLISTDKAVRPTSVMGATKRVAEQIVQQVARRSGTGTSSRSGSATCWAAGAAWCRSSCSRSREGGPVTVTHPEMRRYFMTIPEAVQLVLQAGALGRGGEVFVLDMGEPVKIVDLATDLIRLSGREVGRDIEIRFSGIRPGEKLYEELFFGSENATPTGHPKVLRAKNADLPDGTTAAVGELIVAARDGLPDEELRELLQRLVPDFEPRSPARTARPARGRRLAGQRDDQHRGEARHQRADGGVEGVVGRPIRRFPCSAHRPGRPAAESAPASSPPPTHRAGSHRPASCPPWPCIPRPLPRSSRDPSLPRTTPTPAN